MADQSRRDEARLGAGDSEAGELPGGSGLEGSATGQAAGPDPSDSGPDQSDVAPSKPLTEDERLLESQLLDGLSVGRDAWRVFRIMGEFVEGFEDMAGHGPCVCVFGSARTRPNDPMYQKCVETARRLGDSGFGIITGGGPGMMEAANRGAREAGVPSIGCNIELPFEQGTNPFVDVAIDFRYFFVRKTMFLKYAEAFVIFPGGFGTMDELFESLTLIQTGKVRDFPVVLFGTDYWSGMLAWIRDCMAAEGKISPDDLDLLFLTDSPEEAVHHVVEGYQEHLARRGSGAARATTAP